MRISKVIRTLVVILVFGVLIQIAVLADDTENLLAIVKKPVYIDSGFSFYINFKGELFGSGHNYEYKIGDGLNFVKIMDDVVYINGQVLNNILTVYVIKSNGDLYIFDIDKIKPKKLLEDISSLALSGWDKALAVSRKGELLEIDPISHKTTKLMDNVKEASTNFEFQGIFFIKNDNSLWSFGKNDANGILGDGTTEARQSPKKILDNIKQVVSSSSHAMALGVDGTLWSWGDGDRGQLGNASRESSATPIKILEDIKYIDVYGDGSLAVKSDGSLWSWGFFNTNEFLRADMTIGVPYKIMDKVVMASMDLGTIMAIKNDGTLWGIGSNNNGQFGNGMAETVEKPIKIMSDIKDIASANTYTMVLKKDATVWAWGRMANSSADDKYGKYLGDDKIIEDDFYSLTPIKIFEDATAIAATSNHRLVLKKDGSLWTWGSNNYGELGDGSLNNSSTPIKIMDNVKSIDAYAGNSAALCKDGTFYNWGKSESYLRHGSLFPQKKSENVIAFSSMLNGYMYITNDGRISSIYDTPIIDLYKDKEVVIPTNITKLIGESGWPSGYIHALTTDGALYIASDSLDHEERRFQPVKALEAIKDISRGMDPYIIKSNGDLVRYFVEKKSMSDPILKNMERVVVGGGVFALDKEANLYAWGRNNYGQLANGKATYHHEPIKLRSNLMIPKEEYVARNTDKAEALKPLGVFKGTDKGFELERPATRVEAAVMLTRLLGKEEVAIKEKNTHPFIDIPKWADNYIAYLYKNNLTSGISEKLFGSNNICSPEMYITFILRALNYSDKAQGDFTYSESLDFAVKIGLITAKEKEEWARRSFLRDDLAGVSYDALNTNLKDSTQRLSDKIF